MAARACILGCEGMQLSETERAFFRDADPWGFILFARNVETPAQLQSLTAQLRACVGREAPILIDQEGGRVARLRAPLWREWAAPLDFVQNLSRDAAAKAVTLRYRLIAEELHAVGIDVNCAPMIDVAGPQSHQIIRNRCFGTSPQFVADLGRAAANGLMAGGVLPIIKHIPGHGRASLDSHFDLPVLDAKLAVLEETDFVPFSTLSDLPMAMTAHIVFSDIDPDHCITLSPKGIAMIRDRIGFDGLLMTDDLSMKALQGGLSALGKSALQAGCDMLLHCNGNRSEMQEVLAGTPVLSGGALDRADRAIAARKAPEPFDAAEALAALATLTSEAAYG